MFILKNKVPRKKFSIKSWRRWKAQNSPVRIPLYDTDVLCWEVPHAPHGLPDVLSLNTDSRHQQSGKSDYLALTVRHQLVAYLFAFLRLKVAPRSIDSSRLQNSLLRDVSGCERLRNFCHLISTIYLLTGDIRCEETLPAPADYPKSVIWSPSPWKLLILSLIHCRAIA